MPGTQVNVQVNSVGQDAVIVPNLGGIDRNSATVALGRAGLRVGSLQEQETDQRPPGTILGQNPGSGSRLARGCPVDLVVAKRIPRFPVPNLFGFTERDARGQIRRLRASGWLRQLR